MKKKSLICHLGSEDDAIHVEWFLDALQEVIRKTKLRRFYVHGTNLNWKRSSGHLILEDLRAKEVLYRISPGKGNINMDIEIHQPSKEDPWKFKIIIFHHDCPDGSNYYFYSTRHYGSHT